MFKIDRNLLYTTFIFTYMIKSRIDTPSECISTIEEQLWHFPPELYQTNEHITQSNTQNTPRPYTWEQQPLVEAKFGAWWDKRNTPILFPCPPDKRITETLLSLTASPPWQNRTLSQSEELTSQSHRRVIQNPPYLRAVRFSSADGWMRTPRTPPRSNPAAPTWPRLTPKVRKASV